MYLIWDHGAANGSGIPFQGSLQPLNRNALKKKRKCERSRAGKAGRYRRKIRRVAVKDRRLKKSLAGALSRTLMRGIEMAKPEITIKRHIIDEPEKIIRQGGSWIRRRFSSGGFSPIGAARKSEDVR